MRFEDLSLARFNGVGFETDDHQIGQQRPPELVCTSPTLSPSVRESGTNIGETHDHDKLAIEPQPCGTRLKYTPTATVMTARKYADNREVTSGRIGYTAANAVQTANPRGRDTFTRGRGSSPSHAKNAFTLSTMRPRPSHPITRHAATTTAPMTTLPSTAIIRAVSVDPSETECR